MNTIKSYQDLIAWQKAINLVTAIYALTRSFPDTEKYGLTSQINRSAVSIPVNIAEGWGQKQYKKLLAVSSDCQRLFNGTANITYDLK